MNDNKKLIDHAFLTRGAWFGALPEPLQQLILERSTVRTCRKGTRLVREGARCPGLFAVLDGRVHIVRERPDASRALIYVGEPGFWFGEYAMLSGQPAIAGVIAATDATLLALPCTEFARIVGDEPAYYQHFALLLCERFATAFRYASDARTVAAEQWLRTRLQDLAVRRRLDTSCDGPVEIAISQSELANMVGVSRQTLSSLLQRMQERGLVEVAYKKIRVLPASAAGRA